MPSSCFNVVIIQRIESRETQPILFGDLVLFYLENFILFRYQDQQVVEAEQALKKCIFEHLDHMADESGCTIRPNKRFIVDYYLLISLCVVSLKPHN